MMVWAWCARRLAAALSRIARVIFPRDQREWADAMSHELAWIQKSREALGWSASGLRAAVASRAVWLLEASPVVRAAVAGYLLWTLHLPIWLVAMGVAYRRGELDQLRWLASRTSLNEVRPFLHFFGSVIPLDVVSLVGTVLTLFAIGALLLRRMSAAFRALLPAFVLYATYWNIGYALQLPGFEALNFGRLWPLSWVVQNLWLMLILLLLWCAAQKQRPIA
jgi:hypothetical protein